MRHPSRPYASGSLCLCNLGVRPTRQPTEFFTGIFESASSPLTLDFRAAMPAYAGVATPVAGDGTVPIAHPVGPIVVPAEVGLGAGGRGARGRAPEVGLGSALLGVMDMER